MSGIFHEGRTKNKGCAFEIQNDETSRYFTSPSVHGFSDFVRFLDENRGEAGHAPLPLHKRIPQTTQISEVEWRDIADNQDTGYSCFIVVNIPKNQVWVNEDTGAGMALYCFPFIAVIKVAASGAADPWAKLLAEYPDAKMGW